MIFMKNATLYTNFNESKQLINELCQWKQQICTF